METLDKKPLTWIPHEKKAIPHTPHTSQPGPQPSGYPPAPVQQVPPQGSPARRFSFWRLIRICVALMALATLLWWLVVPLLFPVTSRALVNARTVQARSPIDGTNAEMSHEVGDEVVAGESLLRVVNRRVDTSHVSELKVRVSSLEAQKSRLTRELQECEAAAPGLRATVSKYQKAVLECLAASVREAKARTESARIELDALGQRQKRVSSLKRGGVSSGAEVDDVEESLMRSRKNLEKEKAVLTRLEGEWKAAQQGVFLQNEASYSRRRADELDQKILSLKANLKENSALLAGTIAQLRDERRQVERLTGVNIVAPVSGPVWKRPGNLGQVVKQNELIYEIADRNTIFVEALFHQRYLSSSLVPGARAIINLTSGQRACGRVRAIRTLGEADTEASVAVKLSSNDLRQVHVLIALDEECRDVSLIGRHVRVLIVSDDPSPLEQAVAWVFTQVGG